ncbi:MAG TPA: class I adenylate-forming enzyme family protein [Burkholderiales bacterium]|nr:class I adenylate-forming enzyme family protein [Burkholderiales bacterium]
MHWTDVPEIREETHFGRVVRCFSDRPRNLDAMFAATVARHGARPALVDSTQRLDYAKLDRVADRVAGHLHRLGVVRGDRIVLLLANEREFAHLLLAAVRLGVIAVLVNIREQRPEIAFILNQCGAKAIAFDAALSDRVPARAEAPAATVRLAVGGDAPGAVNFDTLMDSHSPVAPRADAHEEDTAVILYTSGTTGRPKGAMLTHLNLIHTCLHYRACMRLSAADRSLLAVPASHVTGLAAILLPMFAVGGCVALMREFKARPFLELAARERMTHTLVVPAIYNLCLREAEFDRFDLSSWRIGGFGGAPMPEGTLRLLAEKLPGLTLMNAYGATETTSPTTIMPMGLQAAHLDSVGVIVPCGELRVMDDDGREVESGQPGEIWIAGPMVVPGYWDNPEATAREFAGGYWKSGDVGSIDALGFVRVFDRKKDLVNRGGYKIHSAEVESVLSLLPSVVESALVAQPDPVLGEKAHAYVVTHDPACTVEVVRAHCARHLADYKVPDFVTLRTESLPRNANGKLLKRLLREAT